MKKFQRNQQISDLTVHEVVSFVILALTVVHLCETINSTVTSALEEKVVQDIVRGAKPIEAFRRHGLHYKSNSKE